MAELQDQISWSEEVVSPPKLAGYAKEVPALCLVVKGWTGSEGDGEWQNINEGQVVRISSIIGQRRVLAETDRGDFLSFPEEFKVKVKVKEMKGKIKWRTLHDVTQKYQLPATVFTNQNRVYSSEQARQLSLTTTSLVVIATYTERFLLGNDINGDVISKSPRMIPFYRDVQLRVGIGATSGNPNQWQALRQSYKQALGKQIYPRNNGPNVVLLFKAENIRRRMGTKTFNTLINAMNHKQQRANKTTSAKMNLPGGRHAPTFKVVINPDEPLEFCHIKDSYDTIDRDIDDKSNRDVNENVNRDVNENVESSEVEKSIMIKETTNEEEIVHEATLVYAKVEKKKVADEQPVHDKSVTISESTDDVFVELALEDDDSSSGLTNQDAPSEVHVASYEDDVNTAALNEEKRTLSESTSTLTGVHQYGTTFINGNRQDTDVGLYGEETKSPTFENRYDATNTSTMNSKSEWLNKTEDDEAPRYNTNQRLNNSVFQDIRHTKMTEEQGKRTATVIHLRETAPLSDMMVRSELDLRAEADPRSAPIRRTASTQMLTNPNPFLSVNIGSSQSINIAHLPQTQTLTQSVQVSATYPIVGNAVQEGPVLTQGRRAIENEDQPAIENTVRRAIENGNDEPVPVQEIFEKEHKQTHEKEQPKFQYTNESRDPSPRSYYSKQSPDYVQGGRSRMYVEGYGQPQPLVYPQREVFVADYPRPMVYGMPTYPQYPIMQPQPVNYVPQPTLVPVQPREVYADPYQGYPVEERVRYRGGSPNDDVQPRSRESTRRRQPREEKIKKSTKNREYASRPNRYDDDYIDLPVRRGNQSEKWEVTEDIRMADNQTPVYEEPIRRRETKRNQKSRDEWETGYLSDRKYDASLQRKQRARDDDRYDQQDFEEVKVTKTKSAVYDAEYRRSSFDDFDGMPTEGPLVNGVDLFSERDNQYEQKSSGRNDSSRYSAAKKTDSSRYSAATKSTADDRASDELFHSSRYISSPVRTTKVSNGQSAQTRSYTNDLFTRNINVTSEDFNPYAAQTSRRFTYQQSDEPRYRNRLHSRTKQYSPSSPSRPSTYRRIPYHEYLGPSWDFFAT